MMSAPALIPPRPMMRPHTVAVEVATRVRYRIINWPRNLFIEATLTPAYAVRKERPTDDDIRELIIAQEDFERRFVPAVEWDAEHANG